MLILPQAGDFWFCFGILEGVNLLKHTHTRTHAHTHPLELDRFQRMRKFSVGNEH